MKPNILLAVSRGFYSAILSPIDLKRLHAMGNLSNTNPDDVIDKAFLLDHIGDADIVVSSWGTAPFDADVIAAAPRLKLLCHGAGSVRPVVTDALWERGVQVTSSAAAIAYGVAEFCLGLILTCSKRVPWFGKGTEAGFWAEPKSAFGGAFEIYQQRIGIIGAGHIGRQLTRLLQQFTCEVAIYDPYLSAEAAAAMGAVKVDTLEELFATSRAVSLNAPTNEGTRGMLRGEHFAALQPGSLFINTAGSIQIVENEFIAELRKGRFIACVDRCEHEPVELDHPYRTLPNVLLTPHIAGVIAENRFRIGTYVADEIEAHLAGKPLIHEVTKETLEKMA